jgi:hypothetical protein
MNKMDYDIKELTDYLDKNGVNYTIDDNPSPEKIKRIEDSIKRKEEKEKLLVKEYKKNN